MSQMFTSVRIVKCYGISQDPETKNYIMVMEYIEGGDLRKYLNKHYEKLYFLDKLNQLCYIAKNLNAIHKQGLVHRDFHSGNILNQDKEISSVVCYVTDLGLCRPANEKDQGEVYGVLPYVAPEVSWGKPYIQASDIYSFGIIAYEILSGLPPYYNIPHDCKLSLKIHDGLRPNLDNVQVPQLLKNLIQKCWDADPVQRPTAGVLFKSLNDWKSEITRKKNTKFYRQYEETEAGFNVMLTSLPCRWIHQQAVYTSRKLDFTKALRSLSKPQNSEEINKKFYSCSTSSTDSCESLYDRNNKMVENSVELDIDIANNSSFEELTKQTKRQLSLETQTKTSQGEAKLVKLDEKNQKYYSEPEQQAQIIHNPPKNN